MTYFAPKPTWLPKQSVEEFAVEVGKWLGLEVGQPLEPLVAAIGGSIIYGGLNDHEVDGGAIIAHSSSNFTIYLSKLTAPIRDRFTIAHELGHLFLHLPGIKEGDGDAVMRATRYVNNDDEEQRRAEWEANWFAASLLMPLEEVKKYEGSDPDYVAARFNVSRQAASIRLEAASH